MSADERGTPRAGRWLAVAACLAALACGPARPEAPDETAGSPTTAATSGEGSASDTGIVPGGSADAWPRTVALPDGSALTLAAPPSRIVPGSAGSLDMLASLVPPGRLAAIPAGAARYSSLRDPASPYLARPEFAAYKAEALLALDPDLVLVHSWQSADTTLRLTSAGIPVLRLADAPTWSSIADQLVLLGRLLGVEERARAVVDEHRDRVAALRDGWQGRRRPTALCYSNGGAGGMVAGDGTTNHEILELAGLRDLAAETGRVGHLPLTFEELLVLDPEVLVVSGPDSGVETLAGTRQVLAETAALASLAALRHERVVVLPGWLYTATGQQVVQAAETLAAAVAPWRDGPEPGR